MVIFSTFDGQIRSILDGSKDPTLHVAVRAVCMCVCVCVRVCQGGWSSCVTVWLLQWHPRRAFVASCGRRQAVYLWSKTYSEDWTAFAPNVTQLEYNVEYVEREDEFDAVWRLRTLAFVAL